jgi:hypothetical protein
MIMPAFAKAAAQLFAFVIMIAIVVMMFMI